MSVVQVVVAVLGSAAKLARNPVVRAGARTVFANPKARDAAVTATRNAAYGAGVLARHLVGRRPQ